MNRLVRGMPLVAVIFAGPAVQVYAASDRSYQYFAQGFESLPLALLRSPVGFFFCALASYTLAVKRIAGPSDVGRMALSVLGASLVGGVAAMLTAPTFFGLGDSSAPIVAGAVAITIIAGIASTICFVHRVILRSGISARLEITAHAAALLLPALLLWPLGGYDQSARSQLFGAWPALLALLPYAWIVASHSHQPAAFKSAPLLLLVALSPAFVTMAIAEHAHDRGPAWLWPVREAREFLPPDQRQSIVRRVTTIRAGEPARIGEEWYRFHRVGFYNASPSHVPKPDRIASIQIDVPAADIGLPASPESPPGWLRLQIIVSPRGAGASVRHGFVHVRDGDLTLLVQRRENPDWPNDQLVYDRLLTFIRSIRVPPPARER